MSVDGQKYISTEPVTEDQSHPGLSPFESEILTRIKADYERAKDFRKQTQQVVADHNKQYYNAKYADEKAAIKEFPLPIAQQLCDQLRSYMMDKLYFAGRPCRVAGNEKTDIADAEAKQDMMDWQDYRDDVKQKIARAITDCAVHKMCVAQVGFVENTREEWEQIEEEEDSPDTQTALDRAQGIMPKRKTGNKVFVKNRVPDYIGSVVKMIDPQDLYFGPDKEEVNDPFPLMIRSDQAKGYFDTEDFFFNQHLIVDNQGYSSPEADQFKNAYIDNAETRKSSERSHEYVEWHGLVDKRAVLEHMEQRGMDISEPPETVPEGTLTWAIGGMVDGDVLVRIEEQAHGIEGPNIVVGGIEHEGSVFRPVSIMDKIYAICQGADKAIGMLLENIIQNIDATWIINEDALSNKGGLVVNERSAVLTTRSGVKPSDAVMRMEQTPQTDALSGLIQMYYQMAKDASSLQAISVGQGDPNAETLGEAGMAESYARLGITHYHQTFEDTFIRKLYEMRNIVNMELIDTEFAFKVIGEKVVDWRVMEPGQIKANVDFVCESSSRETNRAVQMQQMLGFLKIAPQIKALGFSVRADLLGKIALENGFSVPQSVIEDLLPTLKLEQEQGIDIGALMAQRDLLMLGMETAMITSGGMAGPGGAHGPGPETKQPLTETDATQSANAEAQPNVTDEV